MLIYLCLLYTLNGPYISFKNVLIRPETVEQRQAVRQAQNENYCFKYTPYLYDFI